MHKLKVTARLIIEELRKRGINTDVFYADGTTINFLYKSVPHVIIGCNPDISAASSFVIARNKQLTEHLLRKYSSVRLPKTMFYTADESACEFLQENHLIVVKPADGAHGNGVTVGIREVDSLSAAIRFSRSYSPSSSVILQEQVSGRDVRVLCIDGRPVAASYRDPATVVGDGYSTIGELIDRENHENRDRGEVSYDKPLNRISLEAANIFLGKRISHIPAKGENVVVVGTANIGTGGRSVECLSELPEDMLSDAVSAAGIAGCFICGVDFIYDRQEGTYYLIELNASPSFGLHVYPSAGKSTDIAKIYVDRLLARYDYLLDGR